MANTIDTKLRFSDTSNNYQTSPGGSSFWAMEGTANGSGSNFGSNQGYFWNWWATTLLMKRDYTFMVI